MAISEGAQSEIVMLPNVDQQSFGALVDPHRRELQAHAYRMLGSVQEAEDLVQDTFLRAWQRRETYAGRAPLKAWLYRIATNLCLDRLDQRQQPGRTLPQARQGPASGSDALPPAILEPVWPGPPSQELPAADDGHPPSRPTLP